jgi:hypothetical protein
MLLVIFERIIYSYFYRKIQSFSFDSFSFFFCELEKIKKKKKKLFNKQNQKKKKKTMSANVSLRNSTDGFDATRDFLPSDVLCAIFARAGPPFASYARVCRRFGQVLRDHHQFLWFLCFELRYSMDLASALSLARRADLIQRQRN